MDRLSRDRRSDGRSGEGPVEGEADDAALPGEGVPETGTPRRNRTADPERFLRELFAQGSEEYEAFRKRPVVEETGVRLIAFHLPQFHPIPENDLWWGRGFTEWHNVSSARPQFLGHDQPRMPGELGYYDLRLTEVQSRQMELARHYGLHGFCYHYYWFAGRKLLDRPLRRILEDSRLDLPFCICWANENWTRRWNGAESELLIAQEHSPEQDAAFIRDVDPILRDPRYIRVDDRPLLIVYRADILPEPAATIDRWRRHCRDRGIGDPFLVAAQTFAVDDPTGDGFDAVVEFPPHQDVRAEITAEVELLNPQFEGAVQSYPELVRDRIRPRETPYPLFRTVMPGWDNTPRRGAAGRIYLGSTPRLYAEWLEAVCRETVSRHPPSRRIVFVNAWNEWGEGAYLEPDRRYGYAYLNATAAALRRVAVRTRQPARSPSISVVVPSREHDPHLADALRSLRRQTWPDLEVILVLASADGEAAIRDELRALEKSGRRIEMVTESTARPQAALNRGVEAARGDFVAVLDGDGLYHPERLSRLHQALRASSASLAFSAVEVVGDGGAPAPGGGPEVNGAHGSAATIRACRSLGYALLASDLVVAAGNLFFRRELFDAAGPFDELELLHAWDFALRSLRYTTPLFVEDRLYVHRLRKPGSGDDRDRLRRERDAVLRRFFAPEEDHGIRRGYPSRRLDRRYFDAFVRACGYERYAGGCDSSDASDGWYEDGWAGPTVRISTARTGGALRLRGRVPEEYSALGGQSLRVILNGLPAGVYELASGSFAIHVPTAGNAPVLEIELRASRCFVPERDLPGSSDRRRLAYLLDEVGCN